jgi:prefoldin alpha subunit
MAGIFDSSKAPDRQRLALEAAYLRQQAEELNAQIQQLAALLAENRGAQASLGELAKEAKASGGAKSSEAGAPWLSPLGAGVYSKAKPAGDSVIIEVGARVAAEKSPSEAKTILEERAKAIEKALGEAQAALSAALRRMDELGAIAEQMR